MQERKPLYMGRIDKDTLDPPIEGIDTLLKQSAELSGAEVTETLYYRFFGQNILRTRIAEQIIRGEQVGFVEDHPELTSV